MKNTKAYDTISKRHSSVYSKVPHLSLMTCPCPEMQGERKLETFLLGGMVFNSSQNGENLVNEGITGMAYCRVYHVVFCVAEKASFHQVSTRFWDSIYATNIWKTTFFNG